MYYHATAGVADEIFLTFFKLYIFKNHSLFFTFSVYRHFFKKVFLPSVFSYEKTCFSYWRHGKLTGDGRRMMALKTARPSLGFYGKDNKMHYQFFKITRALLQVL
jgi:hypothetical protein